jgi:hypothetical protein
MKTRWLPILILPLLSLTLSPDAGASTYYWDNGGADGLWTNPSNWNPDSVPGSNDTVYLSTNCPDAAQFITLDTHAMLATLFCTATNNRAYTISATNGCTLTFLGTTDIQGTRTVPLTINADIRYWDTFSVQRKSQTVTLSGSITPLTSVGNSFIISDAGTLVLGGSNAFGYIRNDGSGEVVVRHPYALGTNYFRNQTADGTLSLGTNTVINGDLQVNANMNLRLNGSGGSDLTLSVLGDLSGALLTVQPPTNASGRLTLRQVKDSGACLTEFRLAGGTMLVLSNSPGSARMSWGSTTSPGDATINGDGSFTFEGDSLYFYSTNGYSGGTFIRNGHVYTVGNDRFPTNGTLTVLSPAVLDMHGFTSTVARLTGNGTIDFDPTSGASGATIVNGFLEPGHTNGVLTFTGKGRLTLAAACTSRFDLVSTSGVSDKVTFTSTGNLTLDGRLVVTDAGGLEPGDYKVFDLNGGGISGGFSSVTLPKGFWGTTYVQGGDVFLRVNKSGPGGAVMTVR